MEIGRIHLKDFKNYEDQEIIFDQPLSIIRGDNRSGKTSLA